MNILFTFVVLNYLLNNWIKCDFILNIKMEYFSNENIQNHHLNTYFKYCLNGNESTQNCEAKAESNILGDQKITLEQFRLTTESINFKILNSQLETREYFLNLSISAMGTRDYNSKKSSEFLSKWNLLIEKDSLSLLQLNRWIKFDQVNSDLKQQLTFNYKLKCSDNYHGSDCNIPVCSSGCDLAKGGYCEKPNQCLCKAGWTGINCDKLENQCDLNCKNGGVCSNKNGKSMCKCDSKYYTGDLCEIRVVNECNSRCFNGASCLTNGECLCAPGFAGDRCQLKRFTSECGSFLCLNGGTCFINNQNEYSCSCSSSFTGKNCQTEITTTTPITPVTTTSTTTTTTTFPTTTSSILVKEKIIKSRVFTIQEIALILIAGVGIPFLAILVAIIFYKIVISNKQIDSESQKCSKVDASRVQRPITKENIYVDSSNLNQGEEEVGNKKFSLNTVSFECEKKQKAFVETEIYSNCVYDDIYSYVNIKSLPNQSKKDELVSYV